MWIGGRDGGGGEERSGRRREKGGLRKGIMTRKGAGGNASALKDEVEQLQVEGDGH